jgi:PPOX class probable F420-dependent enzyme
VNEQPWPQAIEDAQFIRLTTFRRSGVGVATPVWFVVDGNALLVTTMGSTGKAKRLRRTARVTLAVCDRRGRVSGPEFEGNAELVPGEAATDIRRRVMKRYGFGGWILLTLAHVIGLARNRTGQTPVGIRIVRTD